MYGSPRGNRPRAMRRNKGPSREYVPGLGKRARGGCRTRAGQGRDGALVGALQRRAAGCKVYPTGTCMCEMVGADAEAVRAPHARDHGRGGRARGAIANGFWAVWLRLSAEPPVTCHMSHVTSSSYFM